mgnify:CR=1 FL=1
MIFSLTNNVWKDVKTKPRWTNNLFPTSDFLRLRFVNSLQIPTLFVFPRATFFSNLPLKAIFLGDAFFLNKGRMDNFFDNPSVTQQRRANNFNYYYF